MKIKIDNISSEDIELAPIINIMQNDRILRIKLVLLFGLYLFIRIVKTIPIFIVGIIKH